MRFYRFPTCVLAALVGLVPAPLAAQDAAADEPEEAPFLRSDEDSGESDWEAPEEEGEPEPARVIATVGGGTTIRIVNNLDFSQERFAPAYLDLFGAYVLPSAGFIRHGAGLGVALNLTGDGGVVGGVDGFSQFVLAPTYVAHMRPSVDLALTLKAGFPIAVAPEFSPGFDLSGQFAYLLTAGLGAYVELGAAAYMGGDVGAGTTIHPVLSGEIGVLMDYEVLP